MIRVRCETCSVSYTAGQTHVCVKPVKKAPRKPRPPKPQK